MSDRTPSSQEALPESQQPDNSQQTARNINGKKKLTEIYRTLGSDPDNLDLLPQEPNRDVPMPKAPYKRVNSDFDGAADANDSTAEYGSSIMDDFRDK